MKQHKITLKYEFLKKEGFGYLRKIKKIFLIKFKVSNLKNRKSIKIKKYANCE